MPHGPMVPLTHSTAPSGFDPILHRLGATHRLSPEEVAVVRDARIRPAVRNADIFTEGDALDDLAFLKAGWACRYRLLGDGRKQIVNFHIPGDLIGPYTPTAKCFASAITDCAIARIPRAAIADAAGGALSLSAAIETLLASDFEMLVERTVTLGRRNARERMAHLFLELHARLSRVGLVNNQSFVMPLIQEMIGDALGLSVVHVNRTLRRLREERLVTAGFGRVTVHDLDGLIAVAGAEDGSHVPLDEPTGLIPAADRRRPAAPPRHYAAAAGGSS